MNGEFIKTGIAVVISIGLFVGGAAISGADKTITQYTTDKRNLQTSLDNLKSDNDEAKIKLEKAQKEVQDLKDYASQLENKYK